MQACYPKAPCEQKVKDPVHVPLNAIENVFEAYLRRQRLYIALLSLKLSDSQG